MPSTATGVLAAAKLGDSFEDSDGKNWIVAEIDEPWASTRYKLATPGKVEWFKENGLGLGGTQIIGPPGTYAKMRPPTPAPSVPGSPSAPTPTNPTLLIGASKGMRFVDQHGDVWVYDHFDGEGHALIGRDEGEWSFENDGSSDIVKDGMSYAINDGRGASIQLAPYLPTAVPSGPKTPSVFDDAEWS